MFSMLEITSDLVDFFPNCVAPLLTSLHLNEQVHFEGLMEKENCLVSFIHAVS